MLEKEYMVKDFGSKGTKKTAIDAEIKIDTKEMNKAIKKTKKLIKLLKKVNRLSYAREIENKELNYLRNTAECACNQKILEQAEMLSNEICSKHIRMLIEEEKDKIRQGQYPKWEDVFDGVYNSKKRILRTALKELL